MHVSNWQARDWFKAIGVGVGTAVIPSLFMVPMFQLGLSPMPAPPSLVFAESLLGTNLPMPVGLVFHLAYVVFWALVFTGLFAKRNLATALGLGGALWLVVLLGFFPAFGWGIAGTAISVKLIPASFIPHLLFALALWGFTRWAFPQSSTDARKDTQTAAFKHR